MVFVIVEKAFGDEIQMQDVAFEPKRYQQFI